MYWKDDFNILLCSSLRKCNFLSNTLKKNDNRYKELNSGLPNNASFGEPSRIKQIMGEDRNQAKWNIKISCQVFGS